MSGESEEGSLLVAALGLAQQVSIPAGAEHLRRSFPGRSSSEYLEALERAWALRRQAFTSAEQVRDGLLSQQDAVERLRRLCPGFPEEAYRGALSSGFLESR